MRQRLNKYLASCGLGSRRGCEALIAAGRVYVNGEQVLSLGTCVVPGQDQIVVDGHPVKPVAKPVYLMLNKPRGVLVTSHDTHGRITVMDLLVGVKVRLFPVGRLDSDSEGLLLLTNDGELAFRLTHPRFQLVKSYLVWVEGRPDHATLRHLARGVVLADGPTAPARVALLSREGAQTLLLVQIHEGRKRQIRRMGQALGYPVVSLRRIAIGRLKLGDLKPGQYRFLHAHEIAMLRSDVGLPHKAAA